MDGVFDVAADVVVISDVDDCDIGWRGRGVDV